MVLVMIDRDVHRGTCMERGDGNYRSKLISGRRGCWGCHGLDAVMRKLDRVVGTREVLDVSRAVECLSGN